MSNTTTTMTQDQKFETLYLAIGFASIFAAAKSYEVDSVQSFWIAVVVTSSLAAVGLVCKMVARKLNDRKQELVPVPVPAGSRWYSHDRKLLSMDNDDIAKKLVGRVITYYNAGESSVKKDGVRHFVLKQIDHVSTSTHGIKYMQGLFADLDDGGIPKHRTLHIAGVVKVRSRFSSLWQYAKSLFAEPTQEQKAF